MYSVYNEIRVFVSAYVWMTGFGNFLYFDKSQDFSIERMVSMWLRINYFPLLLSFCLNVPLELYYVVPLHTAGFFITLATCKLAAVFRENKILPRDSNSSTAQYHFYCNLAAVMVCLLVHILFYETPAVNFLLLFSKEYHFRFQADKYTAWVGIFSGLFWYRFKAYIQWAYGGGEAPAATSTSEGEQLLSSTADGASTVSPPNSGGIAAHLRMAKVLGYAQRTAGIFLILFWYSMFGYMDDKFIYNPIHPYVFWIPVVGWLMLRNSSAYLCEIHCTALEFFGKITLETYVLQFHVFMCKNVQHIPVIIPGAGSHGNIVLKTLNMLLCGTGFVFLAYWARHHTVTTQTSITELTVLLLRGPPPPSAEDGSKPDLETQALNHKTETSTQDDREGNLKNVVDEEVVEFLINGGEKLDE
jgi:N-acetylneuraminate 9-O-acetyltransferase